MSIEALSETTHPLTHCPAIRGWSENDPQECGAPLAVLATRTIVGDDYGSWPRWSVYFECGHSFTDMQVALEHPEIT